LEIPWSNQVLARRMDSSTQTRKSRFARWENVETIFEVKQPENVKARNILLADDVMTTGATLEACGAELLKHDCGSLSVATIAAA
ncbi:MAG TPA: phosphoribosyltransferase family protein, partial [Adhaeribacter sp.]|nr:phosphoribosyltransferase family protein [Adhaeribacter sp.]